MVFEVLGGESVKSLSKHSWDGTTKLGFFAKSFLERTEESGNF